MASNETQDFTQLRRTYELMSCVTDRNPILNMASGHCLRSLVDHRLELTDPTPNIHTMFVQFNAQFFKNALDSVEVRWSERMKSCAGTCTFRKHNKECVISLSAPLLKLRPRKDLVETLLHEMIHAYLFLTNNDWDRDGHGPNFLKHMHRINKEAGTNITIYHNFHDEVKLYQQHWWKCNGPCQRKPPFFGMVRRSMNRPPGPSDFWWPKHKQNCPGQFVKIKEPENYKSLSNKNDRSKQTSKDNKSNRSLTYWITKYISATDKPRIDRPTTSKAFYITGKSSIQTNNDKPSTNKDNGCIRKDNGNATIVLNSSSPAANERDIQDLPDMSLAKEFHNSHFGNGLLNADSSKNVKTDNAKNVSKNPTYSYSGSVGGSNSGRSNILTKFESMNDDKKRQSESVVRDSASESSSLSATGQGPSNNPVLNLSQPRNNFVLCPVCNTSITVENIYTHVDSCLINESELIDEMNNNINNNNNNEELMLPIRTLPTSMAEQDIDENIISNKRLRLENSSETVEYVNCPVCNKRLLATDINQHLDVCLMDADTARKAAIPSTSRASYDDSVISINSSSNSDVDDSVLLEDAKAQPSTSTSTSENETADREHNCLICKARLPLDVSLNEHLEECIRGVFDDNIMEADDKEDDNDDTLAIENKCTENKYPCPVCMELILENLMNQHLDMCLKDE